MVKKVSIWLTLEPLIFLDEPIHLAEISRKLKRSHATIRKQLLIFEKKGLVTKEKKGRQIFYKLRKESPLFLDYLSVIEKERLIRECEKDLVLKEIVAYLHKNFNNKIIIFGSSVTSMKDANDFDILIIGKFLVKKIKNIEKRLNIKFHIIGVDNLEEVDQSLKKEIIKKHLIVEGGEELIKWMIN